MLKVTIARKVIQHGPEVETARNTRNTRIRNTNTNFKEVEEEEKANDGEPTEQA
jgi:hypothetical protein